jgi:adenosylmethionine-8-amino-7-oxononanoate aminotransferase
MSQAMDSTDLTRLDKSFVWHPFTVADRWLAPDFQPLFIESGKGAILTDREGPDLNRALTTQLSKIAHSSYLGLAHEPGARLAERLSDLLQPPPSSYRVVYSDDGSTAMEAALKIAFQYFQQNGQSKRTKFLSLKAGYHGDTVGAMSLGQSGAFHNVYRPIMFPAQPVMAPICYRCPYNKAESEQRDARACRKCNMECVEELAQSLAAHGAEAVALVAGCCGHANASPWLLKES